MYIEMDNVTSNLKKSNTYRKKEEQGTYWTSTGKKKNRVHAGQIQGKRRSKYFLDVPGTKGWLAVLSLGSGIVTPSPFLLLSAKSELDPA